MRRNEDVRTEVFVLEVTVAATTRPAHTSFVDIEQHCSRSMGLDTPQIDFLGS